MKKKFTVTVADEKTAIRVCKLLRGIYPDISREGKVVGTSAAGTSQKGLEEWVKEAIA